MPLARHGRRAAPSGPGPGRSTWHQADHNEPGFPGGIGARRGTADRASVNRNDDGSPEQIGGAGMGDEGVRTAGMVAAVAGRVPAA